MGWNMLFRAACVVFAAAALPLPAHAQKYPSRQVTIVVPFAAGSATDAAARMVAQHLQAALGQTFVIENKAGANGVLAASSVARAAPDGYTLIITTNSTHSAIALFKSVPYDPIADFTPVARFGSFPSFLAVNPNLPITTPQELVAYGKANPGKLEYGSGNSTGQVSGEVFKRRTGVNMVRVAYRSNPAALTDLIAGHIGVMFPDFITGTPHVKAQKIRPLAVLTRERNSSLPDVPTLNETVMPGFDTIAWAGMFGPANMPREVVEILGRELQKMVTTPETKSQLVSTGMEVFWIGPEQFPDYVKSELVKWTSLIKEAGIEPE